MKKWLKPHLTALIRGKRADGAILVACKEVDPFNGPSAMRSQCLLYDSRYSANCGFGCDRNETS